MRNRQYFANLDRDISAAAEMSTSYARTMVNNGYILNGGALIALPAFQDDLAFISQHTLGIWIPVAFIFGLVAIFFCNFLCHAQAKNAEIFLRKLEVSKEWNELDDKTLRSLTYITGIISYVAFTVGSFLTIFVLGG